MKGFPWHQAHEAISLIEESLRRRDLTCYVHCPGVAENGSRSNGGSSVIHKKGETDNLEQ